MWHNAAQSLHCYSLFLDTFYLCRSLVYSTQSCSISAFYARLRHPIRITTLNRETKHILLTLSEPIRAQDRHVHIEYKSDIPRLAYWWVKLKCDKNVLFRDLWQNTCQWVSVRTHMWLRFCHWVSKHQHIYRNVATYLPLSLSASTVTQSRCWPLVICKCNKNVAETLPVGLKCPYVLLASILPLGAKGLACREILFDLDARGRY